jgi:hypothetical protein
MSQSPHPAPATNPAILSRKFNELWISRSSLKSIVNKINGLSDVGSNHTQPTHSCHPLNTYQLSAWKPATAARSWHRELLFLPIPAELSRGQNRTLPERIAASGRTEARCEGRFTQATAATQAWRPEPLFMPLSSPGPTRSLTPTVEVDRFGEKLRCHIPRPAAAARRGRKRLPS